MLRALSNVVTPVLVMLLVVLTPVGTGQGSHRDQLLDPVFPHIHLASGLTTDQSVARKAAQRAITADRHGPALGAGAGAASTALSAGLTPPVPAWLTMLASGGVDWAIVPSDALATGALAEPPPVPPPTTI